MPESEVLFKAAAVVLVLITPRIWFSACKAKLHERWERFLHELDPHHDYQRFG